MKYPKKKGSVGGQVISLEKERGRVAPVAKILFEDYTETYLIAPEGSRVGGWITINADDPGLGNIMELGKIPEGTSVFNIERSPGDGGKMVRTAGTSGAVVSHESAPKRTFVRMPSKKIVPFDSRCLATVGKVAGSGKKDKPMLHAGQMFHKKRSKSKLYPKVGGTAMNAVDHPHGGGRHPHIGKPSTVSRNTPPGRKVGHIAAKRTGKRKK